MWAITIQVRREGPVPHRERPRSLLHHRQHRARGRVGEVEGQDGHAPARCGRRRHGGHIVMAYIVMARCGRRRHGGRIAMAYVVMAYMVMAYVVMAYIVMARCGRRRHAGLAAGGP